METIKEQLGDIFGEPCVRCGKNHAVEAPSQSCLQEKVEQLQAQALDLRGENEKLKAVSKEQGKECELRHNLLCNIYKIVDEYFSTEP